MPPKNDNTRKYTRFAPNATIIPNANKPYSYPSPTHSLINGSEATITSKQIPHSAMKANNTQSSNRYNQEVSFYSSIKGSSSNFGYPKQNETDFKGNGRSVTSGEVDIRGSDTGIAFAGNNVRSPSADVGDSCSVSIYGGNVNEGRANKRSDYTGSSSESSVQSDGEIINKLIREIQEIINPDKSFISSMAIRRITGFIKTHYTTDKTVGELIVEFCYFFPSVTEAVLRHPHRYVDTIFAGKFSLDTAAKRYYFILSLIEYLIEQLVETYQYNDRLKEVSTFKELYSLVDIDDKTHAEKRIMTRFLEEFVKIFLFKSTLLNRYKKVLNFSNGRGKMGEYIHDINVSGYFTELLPLLFANNKTKNIAIDKIYNGYIHHYGSQKVLATILHDPVILHFKTSFKIVVVYDNNNSKKRKPRNNRMKQNKKRKQSDNSKTVPEGPKALLN